MAAKKWVCAVCGYIHEGDGPPGECPVCGAGAELFEVVEPKPAVPAGAATPAEPAAEAKPAPGGLWVCAVCGYVHDGDGPPEECPVCGAGADAFESSGPPVDAPADASERAEYLSEWERPVDDFERKYARIVVLAKTGKSPSSPMRTQQSFPEWDTILFRGAQLARMPRNEDESVDTTTVIGRTAAKPLEIAVPMYVSHMSFGALSREAKIALARGSRLVGTAMCSGEGGLLPVEREEAAHYVYELGTAPFSHRDDAIRQADAVEIKIGQAAKPGLGGHLPAEKVTAEIARIRGIAEGEASVSPGRFTGVDSPEDLARVVDRTRELLEGKPVGIKITAGHVEGDLDAALSAGPDFITIDCRGGATGSAPTFVKDNVCLPPIFALHRARKHLDERGSDVTLCVTGGFRDASDIAKAIAMGADAVALATASLIAIGCQQYRICHTGRCPVGITTQDPALRERFDVEESVRRFVNFYEATKRELETFARINGRARVHDLDRSDLFTLSEEVARHTGLSFA
jgi:glutamate synthase domain-containing protein 2/rubredoxin